MIFYILHIAIDVFSFVLFVSVILSWFSVDRSHPIVRALDAVTEPVLAPVRKILPPFGGLDLSPMVVFVLLQLLKRII